MDIQRKWDLSRVIFQSKMFDILLFFKGFHRLAVVLVPSEEDYDKRKEKKVKEGGRKITYDSMMKWKGNLIYSI